MSDLPPAGSPAPPAAEPLPFTATAGPDLTTGPEDTTPEDTMIVSRGATRRSKRRKRRRLLIEWAVVLAVAAAVAVLLRAFVVQAFFVPSPSMEPTLQEGDRILVVKMSLLTGPVTRGSIVVFKHPSYFPCNAGPDDNIQDLVKRVIGLPGETISSVGNTIYIDGKALSETGWYRAGYPEVGPTPIAKQVIPTNEYFVMGDNRTDSCDSRTFGPIVGSSIIGQVELIVWRNGHPYFHVF
jgi:signal peptidase I